MADEQAPGTGSLPTRRSLREAERRAAAAAAEQAAAPGAGATVADGPLGRVAGATPASGGASRPAAARPAARSVVDAPFAQAPRPAEPAAAVRAPQHAPTSPAAQHAPSWVAPAPSAAPHDAAAAARQFSAAAAEAAVRGVAPRTVATPGSTPRPDAGRPATAPEASLATARVAPAATEAAPATVAIPAAAPRAAAPDVTTADARVVARPTWAPATAATRPAAPSSLAALPMAVSPVEAHPSPRPAATPVEAHRSSADEHRGADASRVASGSRVAPETQALVAPDVEELAASIEDLADLADAPEPAAEPARGTGATRGSTAGTRRAAATAPAGRTAGTRRRPSRAVARFGVLGSLAAVTVVVPVAQGLVHSAAADEGPATASAASTVGLPSTVTALTGSVLGADPPAALVAPAGTVAVRDTTMVSRDLTRQDLANCSGLVPDEKTATNGHVPDRDLCTLWDGHTKIRADAAVALAQLNSAYVARFGHDICLASGYRSLAAQYAVKAERGGLAATPGTSNHGWGLAIDLCSNETSGAAWTWINENAPVYGWKHPAWALPGGVGPHEAWHWEFASGVEADGSYSGY